MKRTKILMLSILITNICFSQDRNMSLAIFKDSLFSNDKFQITKDTIQLGNGFFEIIKAKSISKSEQTQVFIQRTLVNRKNGQVVIMEPLYMGSFSSKTKIYHPIPQPIKNKYFVIDCNDKGETINILSIGSGNTIRLKGYYFAISSDSTIIYTKSKDTKTFYKYNLKLNNKSQISYLPPKENLKFYELTEHERF